MTWLIDKNRPTLHRIEDGEFINDTLEDMIHDIEVDTFKKAHVEDSLKSDMEESLYLDVNFLQECHLC